MELEEVARQLRKPDGENGIKVGQGMNKSNAFIYNLTLNNINFKDNAKVLEIGFGNGAFIKDVLSKAHNINYHGIDISETMLEQANEVNQANIRNGLIKLNLANVENIPYPDNFFDIIFTINTIYFWNKPEKDIQEISRVLKKDGLLCISIRPEDKMKNMPFTQFGFNLFSIEKVKDLFSKTHLEFNNVIEKSEPKVEVEHRQNNDYDLSSACIFAIKK